MISFPNTRQVCLETLNLDNGVNLTMKDGRGRSTPDDDDDDLSLRLSGRTLRAYWYMLNHRGSMSLREIQRGTRFSSASLAAYHLRKLSEMRLVEVTPHGDYQVKREVRVGVTRFFMKIRSSMIPRFALYASFYASALVLSLLLLYDASPSIAFMLGVILVFGFVTSVLETLNLYQAAPA